MKYLQSIEIPTEEQEWNFLTYGGASSQNGPVKSYEVFRTCYSSKYPFGVLSRKIFNKVSFSDITILCGSNGSGKSTLLNIIANKLNLRRTTPYNRSAFYEDYLKFCDVVISSGDDDFPIDIENAGRIITSDDVFDYMLQLRIKNEEIDLKRQQMLSLQKEYRYDSGSRPTDIDFNDPGSVKEYRRYAEMTRKTGSKYIRDNLGFNTREFSNGESGYQYFIDAIQHDGLYLLDEPENSLAAELQIELAKYIPSMARHFNCQFIISTHSPFLLAMPDAMIYDMDQIPVVTQKWTQLKNVQLFHDFFKEHEKEF